MGIHRVGRAHFERFVTGDKDFVERSDISAKAKLFLMWMTSHSDSYRIHVTTMTNLFKEGKAAIYEGLKELALHGFMCKHQPRINGRMGATHYLVSIEALTDEQWQAEIEAIDWYLMEGAERLKPTASRLSESGDAADEATAYRFSASGKSDTKNTNTKNTNNNNCISISKNINARESVENLAENRPAGVDVEVVGRYFEECGVRDFGSEAYKFMQYNDRHYWICEGMAITQVSWRNIASIWQSNISKLGIVSKY